MKKIICFLLVVLALTGCGEKSPQELFDESKSGVVMILNEFYYTLTLPDGTVIYFTGLDSDGTLKDMAFNQKEILSKRQAMTGTGFFIDSQGTIMTNRHVAQPQIDRAAVKNSYNQLVSSIKAYYSEQMSEMSEAYQTLERQKNDCYSVGYYGESYVDEQKLLQIESRQSELADQFNTLNSVRKSLNDNLSLDELKIASVCEIGIAYNNTFITSEKDFVGKNPCVMVKVSGEENVDLALLQLKDKRTPDGAHVFAVDGSVDEGIVDKLKEKFRSKDDRILQIDQQLYMIGYNAGPTLANTRQGVQVQMTSGKVTQMPDGERVLYSIPTVQGSSGSPVVNARGQLVAVNFAKLVGSDNFNFGIPLNKIQAFVGR